MSRFRSWRLAVGLAGGVAMCLPAPATVVINEFMADNASTLADGDGAYSDWIELCNAGTGTVNLGGWYLTDDPAAPTKWSFPSTNLAPGAFLVVFASGQASAGYVDASNHLHTTFRLAKNDDGEHESLLLVRSDGVTVEHGYTDYPPQREDVSYGLAPVVFSQTMIGEGHSARAFVPSGAVAGWNELAFNPSNWLSGTTGIGYERQTSGGYRGLIGLDVGSMYNVNGSVYIRLLFDVADPAAVDRLELKMKYDDGFVAHLNGVEVVRTNSPASVSWFSLASVTREASTTTYDSFKIDNGIPLLQAGTNVLAIQGLNTPRSSSDLLIYPVLTATDVRESDTNAVLYLPAPTPGAANLDGVLDYVKDTRFSVDRGLFTNAFQVAITTETADASIYYTTDGRPPSPASGRLYAAPLTIATTTVLRAAAYKAGWQPSDVDTQTYLFPADVVSQPTNAPGWPASPVNGQRLDYGMDTKVTASPLYAGRITNALLALPSVSLALDPACLFNIATGIYVNAQQDGIEWERPCSVELLNPDGAEGFQVDAGLRIRGGVSRSPGNPKHSFRLFFRSEYGAGRLDFPLFGSEGADSFDKIDLRTSQNFSWNFTNPQYATWLDDVFSRDTQRDMGHPYTRSRYYHLYLNGQYWGLYQSDERAEAAYGETYLGGGDGDYDTVKSDNSYGYLYATDGSLDAISNLWTQLSPGTPGLTNYFRLQGLNPDGTRNPAYPRLVDADNLADYMLLVFLAGNRDMPVGPPGSYTMPRNLVSLFNRNDPDGFKYVAHDCEMSVETAQGPLLNRVSAALASKFEAFSNCTPWWVHLRLSTNEEYRLRFADRAHRHFFNGGAMTADACANRWLARAAEIDGAIVAESARWGDTLSASTARTRDADWLPQVTWHITNYFQRSGQTRSDIVLGQLVARGWYPAIAAPVFAPHGGVFSNGFALPVSATGSVYYTLDGTDPRTPGTGAPRGTLYTGPVPLPWSVTVKARAWANGEWSALNEAVFASADEPPLRISEIHYHPGAPAGGTETNYPADGFEFVELVNAGTQTVGLADLAFTGGVRFAFADGAVDRLEPGGRVVLVQNLGAFQARYTNWASIRIAGEYRGRWWNRGKLDDDGEDVTLIDGAGRVLQAFRYDPDWHPNTGGEGFSLERIDPAGDGPSWTNASAWRPSILKGGTPGEGPGSFWLPGEVVINEALTHQDADSPGDWIEILNLSTNTLDLNGWFLSDDPAQPAKCPLAGVPPVPPGGYAVLTEVQHFGTNAAGAAAGFALSEAGESVLLSSGSGGALTGYRAQRDFGAADNGVTFGVYAKSDGTEDFTAMSASTYGAANAYPRVGPVVIAEVMYHPADSNAFEYVELLNLAPTNVPLYDVANPGNRWKLRDAADFTFPAGVTLAAGGRLLLVPTNEAAFRAAYPGTPPGVPVYGPFTGKLDNAGASVELCKPGDTDPLTGEVPYILADKVKYDDEAPWPVTADGGGASLERRAAADYGNDPINWVASFGAGSPGVAPEDADVDGLPDAWEAANGLDPNSAGGAEGAAGDKDGDGRSNAEEFIAMTQPTNAADFFRIDGTWSAPDGASVILSWRGATGRTYSVYGATNLFETWSLLTNRAGGAGAQSHTNAADPTPAFFRLQVTRP